VSIIIGPDIHRSIFREGPVFSHRNGIASTFRGIRSLVSNSFGFESLPFIQIPIGPLTRLLLTSEPSSWLLRCSLRRRSVHFSVIVYSVQLLIYYCQLVLGYSYKLRYRMPEHHHLDRVLRMIFQCLYILQQNRQWPTTSGAAVPTSTPEATVANWYPRSDQLRSTCFFPLRLCLLFLLISFAYLGCPCLAFSSKTNSLTSPFFPFQALFI